MPRAALVSSLLAFPSLSLAQATFEVLPPVPGVEHTYATHISADGQVIAGYTRTASTFHHHIFRWTAGGGYQLQSHAAQYGFYPVISDISPDGSAVCGIWFTLSDYAVFRWSNVFEPEVLVNYSFDPRSIRISQDASTLIGGVFLNPVNADTFIHDGTALSFPLRPPPPAWPYDRLVHTVSRDLTTGYGFSPGGEGGFRWDIAANTLTTVQAAFAGFRAASQDGATVAGGISDAGAWRGAVWYHRGHSGPHLLHPGWIVDVDDMSADGSRIVGAYRTSEAAPWQAFVWEPSLGLADLKTYLALHGAQLPANWTFEVAGYNDRLGISADGLTIVGSGRASPEEPVRGWRATLPAVCYANCDASTRSPVLNIADFSCFLARFARGDIYANCDDSSTPPYLDAADFSCFLAKFAAGCP
jgi:hypothetical protein